MVGSAVTDTPVPCIFKWDILYSCTAANNGLFDLDYAVFLH